jgi:hypothetical protein
MTLKVLALAALWTLFCTGTAAQSNKVYKYTDEKGNVVYSQTPPMNGAKAQKLDSKPAYSGRGGAGPSYSIYDYPFIYSFDGVLWQYGQAARRYREQREDARQKHLADLEARCNRNRGTDCNDPETLRYMESTRIPGGRYHR